MADSLWKLCVEHCLLFEVYLILYMTFRQLTLLPKRVKYIKYTPNNRQCPTQCSYSESTIVTNLLKFINFRHGPGVKETFTSYEKSLTRLVKEENHLAFLCKIRQNISILKGLRLKVPFQSQRMFKIVAQKAILRELKNITTNYLKK